MRGGEAAPLMDYVEWVERVFQATVAVARPPMGQAALADVAESLGHGRPTWDDFARRELGPPEALVDALTDLAVVGIEMSNVDHANVTRLAHDVALVGLQREVYPVCFADPLDERSSTFLQLLAAECEHKADDFAIPVPRPFRYLCAQAGIETEGYEAGNDAQGLLHNLKEKGFLRWSFPNLDTDVWPTYAGMVRATRRNEVEWLERLPRLVEEWETTSVEFKRELDLGKPQGKRTLVRSVIALATTKTSRPRFLIVGFDPDTHAFTSTVDPIAISQDRIEDILNAYVVAPVPPVRWQTVGWAGGLVGVLEVLREPAHIPYRVARKLLDLTPGHVAVRHGSHIEPPTEEERLDLEEEAGAARRSG